MKYGQKFIMGVAVIASSLIIAGCNNTSKAADIGGDCCNDLEERVADLEATTARHGNRKMSLKISGHINQMMTWIDDQNGVSDFMVTGSGISGSRIAFSGKAKLSSMMTIGYIARFRFGENSNSIVDSRSSTGNNDVTIDRSYIVVDHSAIGSVKLGRMSAPSYEVANISLLGRGVTGNSGNNGWNGIVNSGYAGAGTFDLESGVGDIISYTTPNMSGFHASIAWIDVDDATSNDVIDASIRFHNEFGPMQFAAGIGYATLDNNFGKASNVMGSLAIRHTVSGINVAVSGGMTSKHGLTGVDERSFYHIEGGLNKNYFLIGATSIYGEYGNYDSDKGVAGNDTIMFGLGVVQKLDRAATEIYVAYRQWEDDDSFVSAAGDDRIKQIIAGVRVKF